MKDKCKSLQKKTFIVLKQRFPKHNTKSTNHKMNDLRIGCWGGHRDVIPRFPYKEGLVAPAAGRAVNEQC